MSKTYRQQFEEALACKNQKEADLWLVAEIQRCNSEYGQSAEEAERIIKINLGYMAGYYDRETARRILSLFGAPHPIFGTTHIMGTLTPVEAFEKGKALAANQAGEVT